MADEVGGTGVRITHDVEQAVRNYDELGIEHERVRHPDDGHLLLNPHTLEPVVQVRPHGAHEREKESARRKAETARAVADAAEEEHRRLAEVDPDERWAEIVQDLVAQDATIDPADRERAETLREQREGG